MYKVIVLTDPETADGFRLAGVDVFEVETPAEATREVSRLLEDPKTGILAINEAFFMGIDVQADRRVAADQGEAGRGRRAPGVPRAVGPQGGRVRCHT
jgi:vacuolar-type H+-ATPase subunit F/Vma7